MSAGGAFSDIRIRMYYNALMKKISDLAGIIRILWQHAFFLQKNVDFILTQEYYSNQQKPSKLIGKIEISTAKEQSDGQTS